MYFYDNYPSLTALGAKTIEHLTLCKVYAEKIIKSQIQETNKVDIFIQIPQTHPFMW